MSRHLFLHAALTLAVLLPAQSAVSALNRDKDLILLANGSKTWGVIDDEPHAGVVWRRSATMTTPEPAIRYSMIASIEYAEMRGTDTWSVMQQHRKSGQYLEAAVRAQQLGTGGRVWMRVYGPLQEGECWELLGAWDRAATAFGKLVAAQDLRGNRWYMDGLYRQGVALARQQKVEQAQALLKSLQDYAAEFGKDDRTVKNKAEARARALHCALVAAANKFDEAVEASRKIAAPPDDADFEFHWGNFWAGFLRENRRWADAAKEYQSLLTRVKDPASRAVLNLGRGICLAEQGDQERALLELLKLDALPYGSPEQRLEASFYAGRILWDLSQKQAGSSDETKRIFAQQMARDARSMITAVIDAPIDSPYKAKAAEFQATLPPDPDAPPPAAASPAPSEPTAKTP